MSDIDPALFRQVLGHFPTGVTVITATGSEGRPAGFAVGSFFSVSLDPPLVGFCAGKSSSSWPGIRAAGAFCVNVLAEDQEAVCRAFSSKAEDKFTGLGWSPAASGSPRLHDVLAWIDCDIEVVHDAGDHEICLGRVRELAVERETGPLLFYRGGYGRFAV
jgi:3-hydroxy-9,10-secoandrosta-1,3,5(10)-triene-9,17-dione monooxygenase reductase component